jgi:hypothetical protein
MRRQQKIPIHKFYKQVQLKTSTWAISSTKRLRGDPRRLCHIATREDRIGLKYDDRIGLKYDDRIPLKDLDRIGLKYEVQNKLKEKWLVGSVLRNLRQRR